MRVCAAVWGWRSSKQSFTISNLRHTRFVFTQPGCAPSSPNLSSFSPLGAVGVRWHPAGTHIIPAQRWMPAIGREGGIRRDNYGWYSWLWAQQCEKVGRKIKRSSERQRRDCWMNKRRERGNKSGKEGENGKVRGSEIKVMLCIAKKFR